MCKIAQAVLSRRQMLQAASVAAGAAAVPGLMPGPAEAAAVEGGLSRAPGYNTRVVLLGTAGGPIWWPETDATGISTAVVVGGATYLVDCGDGFGRRMQQAGLLGPREGQNDLRELRAAFLTHLHSDHVVDYPALMLWGVVGGGLGLPDRPVHVFGPGRRGALPEVFPPGRPAPRPVNPRNPTPGTVDMTASLIEAFATDLNDRMFDTASPDIRSRLQPHDIALPAGVSAKTHEKHPPRLTKPIQVYEDDRVRVSATLVDHGQVFPSFGFRFDTEDGSVVFSGDTTVSQNLVDLAQDCDVLVHEVIDRTWVEASVAGLPVPPEVKEAFLNHLLGAHTTTSQVGRVAERAGAKTLVLNHFVPGNLPASRWRRKTQGPGHYSGNLIVGKDLLQIGVGRKLLP